MGVAFILLVMVPLLAFWRWYWCDSEAPITSTVWKTISSVENIFLPKASNCTDLWSVHYLFVLLYSWHAETTKCSSWKFLLKLIPQKWIIIIYSRDKWKETFFRNYLLLKYPKKSIIISAYFLRRTMEIWFYIS